MKRRLVLLAATPLLPLLLTACGVAGTTTASPAGGATTDSVPTAAATTDTTSTGTGSTDTPTTSATTATSGSGGGSGGSSSTTSVTRCRTADLSDKVTGGDAAMGTQSFNLVFTNKSGHTCTLYGFPGVSWVAGNDGHQVNTPFTRQGSKQTVTLKPGATAHSLLLIGDYQNYDQSTCKPTAVRGYRIYAPDETAAVYVPDAQSQCAASGVGSHIVEAIVAGPGTTA